MGHELAQRGQPVGRRRADDRAHIAQPGLPTPSLPSSATIPASPSATVPPPASGWSWMSAAPGFEVRTSTNSPARAARASATNGASESDPSAG